MEDASISITSGTSVDIKRTDGRVHSAVVSGVNWETRSVTVEWFEKGETKGKEIEMGAILDLNAHLLTQCNQDEPAVNNNRKTTRTTKPNIPTMTNKAAYRSTRNNARPTNIFPAVNGHGDTNIPIPNQRSCETVAPTPTNPVAPRHSMQIPTVPVSTGSTGRSNRLSEATVQNQNHIIGPAGGGGGGGGGVGANAVNNRRSNVVKEVERLKKNREERRQRQAELKEEKEALMNQDPGNPNWEFLAMIREYRNGIEFRPLRGSESVEDHQITVCVRKRPLNKKEITRKEVDVITVPSRDQLVVHEPKNKVDLTKYLENAHFRFDNAFDEYCTNEIVYKYTAQPLVQTIFEGGMATCFAYGQTGSGKTHTMGGDFQGRTQDCKRGIYAMAAKDVFKYLKSPKYQPLNLIISASFFEIYSGKVFDLLADKAKLRVLEDGKQQVQIVGLTEQVVGSVDDVLKLIQHGNAARTSGQTSANSNSSRSHAVFQIVARTPSSHRVHGKFSLIDLAGNERGADTSSANRQTRMEGAEINKSLLALKECIRALGRKGAHLPFRASKLTQVLRDSFIGEKSKTCMIAMISPGLSSCEHSLNTLRYADRVKELAANDPSENKLSPQDGGSPGVEDVSGLDDSDLAQLRSLNEGELSADLFNFHEAVSQLQLMEDDVLDTHKSVLEASQRWHDMDCRLVADTRDVDYDQDGRQLPFSPFAQKTTPARLSRSQTFSQNEPPVLRMSSSSKLNPVTRAKSHTRIPMTPASSQTTARARSQTRSSHTLKLERSKTQTDPFSCHTHDKCAIRSPWTTELPSITKETAKREAHNNLPINRSKSQSRVGERKMAVRVPRDRGLLCSGEVGQKWPIDVESSAFKESQIKRYCGPGSGRTPLGSVLSNVQAHCYSNKCSGKPIANQRPLTTDRKVVSQIVTAPANRRPGLAPLRKCWSQLRLIPLPGVQSHPTSRSLTPEAPPIKKAKSQSGLSSDMVNEADSDEAFVSLKMLDCDVTLPSWSRRRGLLPSPPTSEIMSSLTPSEESVIVGEAGPQKPHSSIPTQKVHPYHDGGPYPIFRSDTVGSCAAQWPWLAGVRNVNTHSPHIDREVSGRKEKSRRMYGKSPNRLTTQPALQGATRRRCKEFAFSTLKNTLLLFLLPCLYFFLMLYLT